MNQFSLKSSSAHNLINVLNNQNLVVIFSLFPHQLLRMREEDLSSPASIVMTSQAQDFELPRKDRHHQGLVELHPQDAGGDGVNVSLSLASQAYCWNGDSDPLGSLLPHSLFLVSNGYGQVLASYALFLHSHFYIIIFLYQVHTSRLDSDRSSSESHTTCI
jgi:hypothetical protein